MKKALLIGAVMGSLLVGTAALAQGGAPTVSVSGGNTPYSTISVSGSGFQAGEQVQIMLGINSKTATADASGNFSGVSLTIPNFPSGLYLVLAVGQSSGLPAFSYLYVNSLYPLASPNSWWVAPGSTITWSGSGFIPNEQVTISMSSTTVATFTTDQNGAFSAAGSSTVPFSLRNSTATYMLDAAQSHAHTTFNIGVSDLYPYVNPSSWYTTPGSQLTFSGAGFGPGEGVSVFLGASTTALAHISTDSVGAFNASDVVTIPFKTSSPAPFRLVGDLSGATALAPVTLAQYYATLTPSSYYAAPGSTVTIGGSGFAGSEVVDLTVGGASSTQATANSSGTFAPVSVKIPPTPNTNISVTAVGQMSGAQANFTMAVGAYYSWMTLSTYWASGGSPLTILGHNFSGGETVTITSASSTLGTATAGDDGSFTANVTVPFQASGPATIFATGGVSGSTAHGTLTVAPVYTDLQLKQYFGTPGEAVEFIGHGYIPNEQITVLTDRTGTTPVATFSADASGNFDNSSFTIPADFAEGNLVLTVTGAHSFDTKSITTYVTGK
jgi:hypothetical protein